MITPSPTSAELWADLCRCSTHDKKVQKVMNHTGFNREDARIFLEVLAEMPDGRTEGECQPKN